MSMSAAIDGKKNRPLQDEGAGKSPRGAMELPPRIMENITAAN